MNEKDKKATKCNILYIFLQIKAKAIYAGHHI